MRNEVSGRLAARYVKTMYHTKGQHQLGVAFAAAQNWVESGLISASCKSLMTALTTADIAATAVAHDFSAAVRARTVIDRLPGIRRVPPQVRILNGVGKSQASFVAQGAPIKVSALELAGEIMPELKVAGIAVLSNELLESSSPAADMVLGDDLAEACAEAADKAFLDRSNAGIEGEKPAAVTYGADTIASTGATFDQVDSDLNNMLQSLVAKGCNMLNAAWICRPETAVSLSALRDSSGALAYPDITVLGGSLRGLPVYVTANLPEPGSPALSDIVLIDTSQIALVDEGAAQLEVARTGSLQMVDNPTNNSATGTATNMISMFQTNCAAFRGVLWMNWVMRRSFVVVLTGVSY